MSQYGTFALLLTKCLAWLMLMLNLGGFAVCFSYRPLSPRLNVASAGFLGLAVSGAIFRLAPLVYPGALEIVYLGYLAASLLGLFSSMLLIFGLAAAFSDIRRQLALALEPPHVRN